jgi:hypothetical protein
MARLGLLGRIEDDEVSDTQVVAQEDTTPALVDRDPSEVTDPRSSDR